MGLRRALARTLVVVMGGLCIFGMEVSAGDDKFDAINRILPGQPVRVLETGGTFGGSFVMNRADSLFLRNGVERTAFSYAGIQGIRVRESSRGRGMAVGSLVGAVSVANLAVEGDEAMAALVGGIMGAFLGSVVGAAISRWPQTYPDRSTSLDWGPVAENTASIALRVGYTGSSEESGGNQGLAASVGFLARNDHTLAFGGELGHYAFSEETDYLPGFPVGGENVQLTGGRTLAINFESRYRPTHGNLRPTLNVGVGPYIDYRKFRITNFYGVTEESQVDWNLGAHVGPGVQIGSGDWAFALEGRYHALGGRGYYADFLTITAGVTWH